MNRTLVATMATVAALGLAACSQGEPEPKFAASEPASSTPETTSPTPSSPPATPDPEPLGPEETVRAWVEAQNLAMSVGNVRPVLALSTPDCRSCMDLVDPVAEIHANGGNFITKGWRIIRSRIVREDAKLAVVSAGLEIRGGRTIASAGADPLDYPADKSIIEVELARIGDVWLVSRFGFL